MGGNRGSYLVTTLGPVAVAPLPPVPKITEISCVSASDLVPFAEGWENERCPAEVSEADYYVTIIIRGNNLTTDWVNNVVKGAYLNNDPENVFTVDSVVDIGDGNFSFDLLYNGPLGEGDAIQFDIDGVQSGWMPLYKAN